MTKPTRFFGLHAHTGASVFDGLGKPEDHFKFVLDNGMDGMAITEHGHCNSFGWAWEAYQKLCKDGRKFKYIPGCEFYLHPDLDEWRDDKDKIDAENKRIKEEKKKAKKKGDVAGVVIDTDDEVKTTTIEDEDASKKASWKNPLKRRHHVVVLPKNSQGLKDLFSLVSYGYCEGQYYFPRIDFKRLKEKGENLVVSTACLAGFPSFEMFMACQDMEWDDVTPQAVAKRKDIIMPKLRNMVDKFVDAVGIDDFFLEIQFNKLAPQHAINMLLMELAQETGVKLVATADSHYPGRDKWQARELYKKLGWIGSREGDDMLPQSVDELKCELFPKNADDMWAEYLKHKPDYEFYHDKDDVVCEAIERSYDIAHDLIGDIEPDTRVKLPSYTVPEGESPIEALVEMAWKGLQKLGLDEDEVYQDRLLEELRMIKDKEFSRYFLTMKAITDIAHKHMLVGFGRGSAAGSLVCYCLGITGIDPIKYGLLFSRFLSAQRKGLPDVDSDFADRDRLLKLLREEFGEDNVIAISNHNTFALKSLVKDIGRFYDVEFQERNDAVKMVDRDIARGLQRDEVEDYRSQKHVNFDNAMKYSLKFAEFINKYPHIGDHVQTLQGEQKSTGRHAGGVVVSENILNEMPVVVSKGTKQTPWSEAQIVKHLEPFGWVKFDLLGLDTLAIIERCIHFILQRHENIENPTFNDVKMWYDNHLHPNVIDLDDQHVYEHVYHNGNFAGVFQCTEKGTQKFFQAAKPRSIIDIATLTSIYRPGPLGAKVDKLYVDAKNNPESITFAHELIKEVLEETYGHLVFQEQAMALGNVVGGMSLDECDVLRKVVSKKPTQSDPLYAKAVELEKRFIEGAVNNGVKLEVAHELYENIKKFAEYSFNKSHAVSYAINSYLCAWLLTYYEPEWLCAYVESQQNDADDKAAAIAEIKSFGYDIVPIDINHATEHWTILPGKKFMPAMTACKGVGLSALAEIKRKRPYKNVHDMLWNDDGTWKHSKFNKKVMDVLVKVGAFESLDCVGEGKLFNNYAHMHATFFEQKNWDLLRKKLKKDTFDTQIEKLEGLIVEYEETEDWSVEDKLVFHKDLLGETNLDLVVPPSVKKRIEENECVSINEYPDDRSKALVWFVMEKTAQQKTKHGKPYLILTVSGASGKQEKVYCWEWQPGNPVPTNYAYVAIVDKNDFGFSTKMYDLQMLPRSGEAA